MEFRILGPLEVLVEGERPPRLGPKQRALLAMLLLHANEVVSSDRLVDELWPDEPESAAAALQAGVSRLRKALGEGGSKLATVGPGYVLRLEPDGFDLRVFERLVEDARSAEPAAAAESLGEALALWRGPALADFAYDSPAQTTIAWAATPPSRDRCSFRLRAPSTTGPRSSSAPGWREAGRRTCGSPARRWKAAATPAACRRVHRSPSSALGVFAEPLLVEPGEEGLAAAAREAGVAIVGLPDRWREEGLGPTRSALVAAGLPTLLVRRGLRPGGLAPPENLTRFTWSLRAG